MITELAGFKINQTINAPMPFDGNATIIGFRWHTSRNTGRTYMVAEYLTHDGKQCFDSLERIQRAQREMNAMVGK
jgi:hypothetical protein